MKVSCGNIKAGMAGRNGCEGRAGGAFGGFDGRGKLIRKATSGCVGRSGGRDTEARRGNGTEARGCHRLTAGWFDKLRTVLRN